MTTEQSRRAIGDMLAIVAAELDSFIARTLDGEWPADLDEAARRDHIDC